MLNNNINYNTPVPMASTVPVQGVPQQGYPYAPQQPVYQGVPYSADQTQFAYQPPMNGVPMMPGTPSMPVQPPATSELGFMDKMKSYFQDVYRSDENLRAYKVFQNDVESNPATLKPGSENKTRVSDLQQKLNMVGIKANINGIYGYATGEAVKEFKRKWSLNDGFLDKNGQPSITDVATPQMQAVLNSAVSKKLNPNAPTSINPMPVSQQELLFARDLETKSRFGYKPSKIEYDRYQDIMTRYQRDTGGLPPQQPIYQQPPQQPVYQPNPTAPVYQQPPQQPIYQPPTQPVYQPGPTAPVVVQPAQLTQEDLAWAQDLQNRITTQRYQPTLQEKARYESVFTSYQQLQQQGSQPTAPVSNGPVTQADLDWAQNLQTKMLNQRYQPSAQEQARYEDIFNRYQNQPANPGASTKPVERPKPAPGTTATITEDFSVTQEELAWAMDLQQRIETQKYQPTQQEVLRYTDIFSRYEKSKQQPVETPTVPTVDPTTATAPVTPGGFNQVSLIVLGRAESAGTMAIWNRAPKDPSGMTGPTGNWNVDRERLAYVGPNGQQVPQMQLTQAMAGRLDPSWQLVYMVPQQGGQPTMPTNQQPTQEAAPTPTNTGFAGAATAQEAAWAQALYGRMARGEQVTQDEMEQYNLIQMKIATAGVAAADTTTPTAPVNNSPITQADVDWALQLQQQVQFNKYEPTQAEVDRYTRIYDQYLSQLQQAPAPADTTPVQTPPQMAPATGAASPEEIQWATQLMMMIQQNSYKASDEEMARYTDIYNRMTATQPVPQQPVVPQQQQPVAPPYQPPTAPGMVQIDPSANDPELQWALELLNRYRQGQSVSEIEQKLYEQIIAKKAVPQATP